MTGLPDGDLVIAEDVHAEGEPVTPEEARLELVGQARRGWFHPKPRIDHIAKGVPVVGFTGINGAGKTLQAVECAIGEMALGRRVFSTVEIKTEWGDSEPIRSLGQLRHLPHGCHVLLDDIAVILSSSVSTTSLPREIEVFLQTARHKEITIHWTAPGWSRAHVLVRLITQAEVNVRLLGRVHSRSNPWPRPIFTHATMLDATEGKVDQRPTRMLRFRIYKPQLLSSWGAYDTHAETPTLGAGKRTRSVCIDCGYPIPDEGSHSKEMHELLGVPWYGDHEHSLE